MENLLVVGLYVSQKKLFAPAVAFGHSVFCITHTLYLLYIIILQTCALAHGHNSYR